MLNSLPIDTVLPQVVAALRASNSVVLRAPAGAGKTTRVPPAILQTLSKQHGQIVMLEPRRIAARTAARRMAFELGERVGQTIGYIEGREAAQPFDQSPPIDAINAALIDEIFYNPMK